MSPSEDRRPAVSDAAERARLETALKQLHAVLTDVAVTVTARMHERCPYRARDERCTFAGGCVNQRRDAARDVDGTSTVQCGGDHLLRRTEA